MSIMIVIANQAILAQDCKPDGTPIGSYKGVVAHSSGKKGGGSLTTDHQCVSYVKEFYKQTYGFTFYFGGVNASDFFKEGPNHGFTAYINGDLVAPQPDDILCYSGGPNGYGHVAIIMEVSSNSVKIIDENRSCESAYDTLTRNGNYLSNNLGGSYQIQGWLRYGQQSSTNIIGLFPNNESREPYTSKFIEIYEQEGGASIMGEPFDTGHGIFVYEYGGNPVQDYRDQNGHIRHLVWNSLAKKPVLVHGGIAGLWFTNPTFFGPPLFREKEYIYKSDSYESFNTKVVVQKFGTNGNNLKTILWTAAKGARHCPVGVFELVEPQGYDCWEYLEKTNNERKIGLIPTDKVILDVGFHHIRIKTLSGELVQGKGFTLYTWEGNNQVGSIDPPPFDPSDNSNDLPVPPPDNPPVIPPQPASFPLTLFWSDFEKQDPSANDLRKSNWYVSKRIDFTADGLIKIEITAKATGRVNNYSPGLTIKIGGRSDCFSVTSNDFANYTIYLRVIRDSIPFELNLAEQTRKDGYSLEIDKTILTYVESIPVNYIPPIFIDPNVPPPPEKSLRVISPNGGENWQIGSTHNILFESTGDISQVKIYCTINNGQDWIILNNNLSNTGSFTWQIAGSASNSCLIKVTDVSGNIFDVSDNYFVLSALTPPPSPEPTLKLLIPNGGEVWEIKSQQKIKWSSTGILNQVKLVYSTDNGNHWQTILESMENKKEYLWTVTGPASKECLVRVMDLDGSPKNTSDKVFSIIEPAPVLPDTNLIHNGNFTAGTKDWQLEVHGDYGCQANFEVKDGALKVKNLAIGDYAQAQIHPYLIQLKQIIPLSDFTAQKYQLKFKYKGNLNWFVVELSKNGSDYLPVGLYQRIEPVINDWQSALIVFELLKPTDINELKLNFQVRTKIGEVYFDDIVLKEYIEPIVTPPDTTAQKFPLTISQNSILLTKDQPRLGLKFQNKTSESFNYTISSNLEFLSISKSSGVLAPRQKRTVAIEFDFRNFKKNKETGELVFKCQNQSQVLPVVILKQKKPLNSSPVFDNQKDRLDSLILFQNHPNPFNQSTEIAFELNSPQVIKLVVFNTLGQEILVLADGPFNSGKHTFNFNGINLPSGVYFYKLITHQGIIIKQMSLAK